MWIEDEDTSPLRSDIIRVIIVESGICLDIVLEEGLRASGAAPRVVVVGRGTKTLRVVVRASTDSEYDAVYTDAENNSGDDLWLKPNKAGHAVLSPREAEVLSHLSSGETNKEIARKMRISDETVRGHIKSIFRKTGMENRTQAALWALSMQPLKDTQE
jgi:DNA-binding NarL/FixJ family response regulator